MEPTPLSPASSSSSDPGSDPAAGAAAPIVQIQDLRFRYRRSEEGSWILDIEALEVLPRERLFLYGPSGCGKTTLLGVLAGVLEPRSGSVAILGEELTEMSARKRDTFRGEHIGYIFQMFNLLPYLNVEDNILLPLAVSPARRARLQEPPDEAARRLAGALGLAGHLGAKASELSVGQQQRVAAARALIGSPELLIADEPTSALDLDRRREFLELLFEQCAAGGTTLLFVSHDLTLESQFDRAFDLTEINRSSTRT